MNSFGTLLRLSTFGESHGPAMGGILDGMPPGLHLDLSIAEGLLARRRPGQAVGTSQRKESDCVEWLSGFSPEGLTLGSPIGFIVRNKDARSKDYDLERRPLRPNHADFTYMEKYGIHDFRGGGRASARETVSWVAAGGLVLAWLHSLGISVSAESFPGGDVKAAMCDGDSVGGYVKCRIEGLKSGVGQPVGDKLHARLAAAMMSINAAKAFEYGDGIAAASMRGSQAADHFKPGLPKESPCITNHSGGVQGGISNGMPVELRVWFKPTPTIMQEIATVDVDGRPCTMPPAGRHDACVALRAAPIVEAMAALVIGDLLLQGAATESFGVAKRIF